MLLYEIKLVYETTFFLYPPLSWKQENEPMEEEMIDILWQYAKKHKVPKQLLEDNAVLFVDSCENGMYSDMEVYGINFQKYGKQ